MASRPSSLVDIAGWVKVFIVFLLMEVVASSREDESQLLCVSMRDKIDELTTLDG